MRLNEVTYTDALPVEGYGPGFFRVGGKRLEGPLLVSVDGLHDWQGLEDVAGLERLRGRVDVILLGMGADVAHPPSELKDAMEAAGIGLELMASASACRTYNVLLGEGRRVAVAALPV